MSLATVQRKALHYICRNGKSPFDDWFRNLKDIRGQAKITKAIAQMEAGNFGDHKPITGGKGLQEKRIHFGPGYRLYYIIENDQLIILFAASNKAEQKLTIKHAIQHYENYKLRKEQGEYNAANP